MFLEPLSMCSEASFGKLCQSMSIQRQKLTRKSHVSLTSTGTNCVPHHNECIHREEEDYSGPLSFLYTSWTKALLAALCHHCGCPANARQSPAPFRAQEKQTPCFDFINLTGEQHERTKKPDSPQHLAVRERDEILNHRGGRFELLHLYACEMHWIGRKFARKGWKQIPRKCARSPNSTALRWLDGA